MKRFVKISSLFLAIILACVVPVSAEEASARSSAFFMGHDAYLYRTTGTLFQVWFDVDAVDGMDELGVSTIKIQKSADGNSWTTIYTYTKEAYPQLICANTGSHAGHVTFNGMEDYYYRAKVTFYAKNSSGIGKYTVNTSKILL